MVYESFIIDLLFAMFVLMDLKHVDTSCNTYRHFQSIYDLPRLSSVSRITSEQTLMHTNL